MRLVVVAVSLASRGLVVAGAHHDAVADVAVVGGGAAADVA